MSAAPTRLRSLRTRLAVLLAVVGLLLLLVVVAAGAALYRLEAETDRVAGTLYDATTQSAIAFRATVDQESGLRGFAITGEQDTLTPYRTGREDELAAQEALDALLADDPELRAGADRVEGATERWREEFAEPVRRQVEVEGTDSVTNRQVDAGQALFDEVRAAYGDYRQAIFDARDESRETLEDTTRLLTLVLLGGAVGLVVSGVLLWLALRRWVTGPLDRLTAEVQVVRGGALTHRVEVDGPPEVVRLASDVDAMRARILDELSAVASASHEVERSRELLEEQAAELHRSNRDLEQFAYVASHDLQEPLRKVASFCQLLERRYGDQLDERGHQYIGFAVDGAKRMQLLINDLLAFSRVGRSAVGDAEVDLGACVEAALRNLELVREETGAVVTVDELPTVVGEAPLLTQLFQNLLGNAMKFRGEEAPRVHVGVRLAGTDWELSCADNGIGIQPQYAERIFVIFQRLHAKDEYAGTGIGLALCKRIVEHHGGRIWLDTEATSGTTFRFTLPVRTADPAAADAPAPDQPQLAHGPGRTP